MPVREISARPRGRMSSTKASTFSLAPVSSKTKLLTLVSTTRARKGFGDAQGFDAAVTGGNHFDQCHFAGDVRAFARQVGDFVDGNKAVELRLDLFDDHGRAAGDHVDAALVAVGIDGCHGQAIDIIASAGKQADDAREHAGLVLSRARRSSRTESLPPPSDEHQPFISNARDIGVMLGGRGSFRCARRRTGSSGSNSHRARLQCRQ